MVYFEPTYKTLVAFDRGLYCSGGLGNKLGLPEAQACLNNIYLLFHFLKLLFLKQRGGRQGNRGNGKHVNGLRRVKFIIVSCAILLSPLLLLGLISCLFGHLLDNADGNLP